MKYRVIWGSSAMASEVCSQLKDSVEGYMEEGFKPQGSIQVVYECGHYTAFQAMIKED